MTTSAPEKAPETQTKPEEQRTPEMQALWDEAQKSAAELQKNTQNQLGGLWTTVMQWFKGLGDTLKGLPDMISGMLNSLGSSISNMFVPAAQAAESEESKSDTTETPLETQDMIEVRGRFLHRMPFDAKDMLVPLDPGDFEESRDGGRRKHHGQDIPLNQGSPIYAGFPCTVAAITPPVVGRNSVVRLVDGTGKIAVEYIHLSAIQPGLKVGDRLGANDLVGKSGGQPGTPGTYISSGPHLHMEIEYKGVNRDVYPHLTACADCPPKFGGKPAATRTA